MSGSVIGATIEAQTAQVLANLRAVLIAAGLDLPDILKTTVHLAHLERDFAGFNAVYASVFSAPYPARTTVGSVLLGVLLEIDCVATSRDL
jgi:enamine deaminase RidA (YjgF/YER057c/UK114 family)